MHNHRYLSRVTPSVARTVINGNSDVQIELEFRSVAFCGGRKTEEPGEKHSEQGENQQQTQPTWDGEYANRTRVKDVGGERWSTAPPTILPVSLEHTLSIPWLCHFKPHPPNISFSIWANNYSAGLESELGRIFFIRSSIGCGTALLFSSFLKNGHTAWFDPQTKKLEPRCITKQTGQHGSTVQ